MKRQHTLQFQPTSFVWIDLIDPQEKDLKALAKQYGLNKKSVLDCLDPEHLPKFERGPNYQFLILRYFDTQSTVMADTVQELTRKLALFTGPNFLISIHRQDSPVFQELRKKWSETPTEWPSDLSQQIFYDITSEALSSYDIPLAQGNDELEQLEMGIFEAAGATPFQMEKGYFLKRKAAVFKRILRSTLDVIQKFQATSPGYQTTALKEMLEKFYFYAEELNDNVAGLMNLYLSMASHRTNEIIRVLTVASLFFLPLNFIAGIYGMNFENMPELKWKDGYFMALTAMGFVGVGLYLWFRHKGWLQPELPPDSKIRPTSTLTSSAELNRRSPDLYKPGPNDKV